MEGLDSNTVYQLMYLNASGRQQETVLPIIPVKDEGTMPIVPPVDNPTPVAPIEPVKGDSPSPIPTTDPTSPLPTTEPPATAPVDYTTNIYIQDGIKGLAGQSVSMPVPDQIPEDIIYGGGGYGGGGYGGGSSSDTGVVVKKKMKWWPLLVIAFGAYYATKK